MRRLLVLDFDGTMTDAEVEGLPFRIGYLEDLAALTGRPLDLIQRMAVELEAEVAARPGSHGWVFGDRIVAPAGVDPYLRVMPVARGIFDRLGMLLTEPDLRARLLENILYKYNYPKTVTAFREGAGELLRALGNTPEIETYVVTNSHTEPVQRKIEALGLEADGRQALDWLVPRVHGRARKYALEEAHGPLAALVDDSLQLPGLDRPVYLRRGAYFDALERLRLAHDLRWENLVVVGDIFELDLALPLALGATVGLMVNAFTPAYERAWLAGHPRGRLLGGLGEVLPWLGR